MENTLPEPVDAPRPSPLTDPAEYARLANARVERWDGWTGEKIAIFAETLAESATVTEACDAANMSPQGAYAARRRNPLFAAAWDAALTIARERLADTLLDRAMQGNVEQIWRDGRVVGERHVVDNRLGLAILRRLDRLAETGLSTSSRGIRAATAPAPAPQPIDWGCALAALRAGDDAGVAQALALAKSYEVDEVDGPPDSLIHREEQEAAEREERLWAWLSERCWWDELEDRWMTDFAPPQGFEGYESRPYDDADPDDADDRYVRECSEAEAAILEADRAAARAAERAEDEELRDLFFASFADDDEHSDEDAEDDPA